jgi:hypothetical protein
MIQHSTREAAKKPGGRRIVFREKQKAQGKSPVPRKSKQK